MKSHSSILTASVAALVAISNCSPTPKRSNTTTSTNTTTALKYITLEEHYDSYALRAIQNATPVYEILLEAYGGSTAGTILLEHEVQDINGSRLQSMNENGIRIQVISNDPQPDALDKPDAVSAANKELAALIGPYPDRFRGFCFLSMALPLAAAAELERCISESDFVGALVDSHLLNNTAYDSPAYDPLWSTFTRLNVPLYLHPTYPTLAEINSTGGLYTPDNNFLRLWVGGVFDRHPELKLVLGHMGEMIPYMLARSNTELGPYKPTGATIPETWARNVWVTTSGFLSLDPFATLLRTTGVERIMYSVDYPWAPNENGTQFIEELQGSGMVTQDEWEGIAFGNAEKLLGVN